MLQAYGYETTSSYIRMEQDILSRYIDYEEMDEYPEVAMALTIFADDVSQNGDDGEGGIQVKSKDKTIEQLGEDLFVKRLRISEDEGHSLARSLCKYGNDFEEIYVDSNGVQGLGYLFTPTMRRVEGPRGELFGFVQDMKGRSNYTPAELHELLGDRMGALGSSTPFRSVGSAQPSALAFEPWEVVHFRLHGKQRKSVYGHSVLEPARWVWKRLMLLEDSAIAYRLQRGPQRHAYYVDTGNVPPQDAMAYVNRVRQSLKKKKYLDPTTGKPNFKFSPFGADEDIWLPTREGKTLNKVEVLASPSWQSMDDINYFKDKFYTSTMIPKAYFGHDGSSNHKSLSNLDIRFARSILRIQRELKNGYSKIFRVHMAALNIDPNRPEYRIDMPVPSSTFELAQVEVRNARADLAARMGANVSEYWILSKIHKLSDEEIEAIFLQRGQDVIRNQTNQANAQVQTGVIMAPLQQAQQAQQAQAQQAQAQAQPAPKTESRVMTERELMAGDRRQEKDLERKLENLVLNSDAKTMNKLNELNGLLRELAYAVKK